jgi:Ca-activated chloride channel family protein
MLLPQRCASSSPSGVIRVEQDSKRFRRRTEQGRWIMSRNGCGKRLFLLVVFLLLVPGSVAAQGWVEPLRPAAGAWIERVESRVRVEVEGNVATVVVDEWFRAHGRGLGEADYLYPLPRDAVFNSFSLYVGEEEFRGELLDAEEARAIYEEIVRKRRDPALIELAGHGLLRARVFPLNPGETRRVTLRFSQLLERAGDALQLRYAGGVPNATICSTGGSAPPNRCEARDPSVSFEVQIPEGDRFLAPFSPTHPLSTSREGSALTVRTQGSVSGPFSLFLPVAREGLGLALVTHHPVGEDGYFLLSLSPGRGAGPPEPRDVTVVLDVSGSMSGEKIDQARQALLELLGSLSARDRFRLVAFSNAVRPFDLEWREARPGDLAQAREWVAGLEANGGTNISGALEEALRLPGAEDRLPVTVFLTDGLPTVGETSVDVITRMVDARRGRFRVFSFGVGNDVNTALLDRMAEEGRGSTSYVAPGESVERALSLLSMKIKHPVLTDLSLTGSPVRLKEMYPVEIPDVFAGEELVLFGRYEGGREGLGSLTLQGRRGGQTQRFALDAAFPEREERNAYLPRLWASRKIGFLTRRVWTEGDSEELVEEIRRTALRYGLPSPYTSYLVLEPGALGQGEARTDLQVFPPGMGLPHPQFSAQGAEAVARARDAKAMRDVASMAELQRAEEEAMAPLGPDEALSRMVAGRLFRQQDGVWKQAGIRDGSEVLDVAPFSRAYFDLLQAIPELKPFAQEFSQLEIQGHELRIGFVEGGVSSLSRKAIAEARLKFLPEPVGLK